MGKKVSLRDGVGRAYSSILEIGSKGGAVLQNDYKMICIPRKSRYING